MVNVAYGCCVGDWNRFRANVVPQVPGDRRVYATSGHVSIATAYNSIMDQAFTHGADVLILLHDDLELTDPDAEMRFAQILMSGFADIVGIAGGGAGNGIAWWNESPIGHQRIDTGELSFGECSGYVDTLEGSVLALGQRCHQQGIRFDCSYPGFHGYDADICAQVRLKGGKVAVVDVDTWHHTKVGFKTPDSERDWLRADQIYRVKWGIDAA